MRWDGDGEAEEEQKGHCLNAKTGYRVRGGWGRGQARGKVRVQRAWTLADFLLGEAGSH